jgi:hypothetical protein
VPAPERIPSYRCRGAEFCDRRVRSPGRSASPAWSPTPPDPRGRARTTMPPQRLRNRAPVRLRGRPRNERPFLLRHRLQCIASTRKCCQDPKPVTKLYWYRPSKHPLEISRRLPRKAVKPQNKRFIRENETYTFCLVSSSRRFRRVPSAPQEPRSTVAPVIRAVRADRSLYIRANRSRVEPRPIPEAEAWAFL